MKNTWDTEEYTAQDINDNLESKKFVVPKYQRGVVWKQSQIDTLMDSIKKGLPFGTILLYYDEEKNNYRLIDGLQRSTAIYKFICNPTDYWNDSDIDDEAIENIHDILNLKGNKREQKEKIVGVLNDWVKNSHNSMEEVDDMQYVGFATELSKEFPSAKEKSDEIVEIVKPMLKEYKTLCKNILNTRIPAIVLKGSDELLPELFERINSKGTQLSKYQIYAATWTNEEYVIDEKYSRIVELNRDRYDQMLYNKTELDDYDSKEFVSERKLNMFEVAFGFGKYVCEKWPELFNGSDEITNVESIGFNLINCCICCNNNEVKKMNSNIVSFLNDEDINVLFDKIIESIKYVDKIIGKFNKFKANNREGTKVKPLHTEFQIVSIVASVFISKYVDIELTDQDTVEEKYLHLDRVNKEWKKNKELFEKNVSKIYISEILQGRWSGTGDKKMDMVIVQNDYYSKTVPPEEFENTIKQWYKTLNSQRQEYKKVTNPKEAEILILTVLYLHEFSASDHLDGSCYDIEHLATKKLMKKLLDNFEGNLRLPISSIGNLCLLPEAINRGKGEKTIYKDESYLDNSKYTLEEIEDKFTFTKEKDLAWLYDNKQDEEELTSTYIEYLDNRFEKMIDRIMGYFEEL